MVKRYKLSRRTSQRTFRHGQRVKSLNLRIRPMRGGTRL